MSEQNLQNVIASGGIVLLDLDALEPGACGRVKLRFTGGDRVRYLNGQISNDTRRIKSAPGEAALSACVMNAKGKMNAYCWVHATADALILDADGGTPEDADDFREGLSMRLERYIIADDVELVDITEDWAIFHLIGNESALTALITLNEGALSALLPASEENGAESVVHWRRSRRYQCEGLDLFIPAREKAVWREKIAALPGVVVGDRSSATIFRIEQGVPRWGQELTENTLPAEAGLDRDAIDFHKGCYIGQEIISRIKSVGRVNRRLIRLRASAPLEAGQALFSAEGQPAGEITSAGWLERERRSIALAYLKRGHSPEGLIVRSLDGKEASIPVEIQPQ